MVDAGIVRVPLQHFDEKEKTIVTPGGDGATGGERNTAARLYAGPGYDTPCQPGLADGARRQGTHRTASRSPASTTTSGRRCRSPA